MNKNIKGSAVIPIIIIVCLLLVVAGYFVVTKVLPKTSQTSQDVPTAQPTSPVTDFAPNIPMNQKTTVLIRQSDSSTITYIIPNDQVDGFIKKLPEGNVVVSQTKN